MSGAERQARWRAKQRAEVERLRRATDERAVTLRELSEARQEIKRLRTELAQEKAANSSERKAKREAKAKAAAELYAGDSAETLRERLLDAVEQVRTKTARIKFLEREVSLAGFRFQQAGMSFATFGKIAACLHGDKDPPSVEQRTEALKLLTAWKSNSKWQPRS